MRFFPPFLLLFFFGLSTNTYAQTKIIDSLKRRVEIAANKEQKVKALLSLCEQKYSLSADLIFRYATEAKKLSQNESNETNTILADYFIAYSMVINSKEDSSLLMANYYLEKLKNRNGEKENYMRFLHLKGIVFYRTNKTKESINTYYDLLNTAQRFNDTSYILIANRGISLAYILNGQDREGIKIFNSAIQLIGKNVPEKYREIYGLLQINATTSYLHLYQSSGLKLYSDSCGYYGNNVVEIGRKIENLFMICHGLILAGVIKSYNKDMAGAKKNLEEGLELRKTIRDTLYIISDMVVVAFFYANIKDVEKGVALCYTAIDLCRKRKMHALIPHLYLALAENYKAVGRYKEYGDALKLQIDIKDSLNLKNSAEELKDLEIKYDLQKQENTIIQQKLNITKKNYWLYGSAIFIVMAATIFWLVFRNYRRKQNIKMQLALAEEKRISSQSIKDAEEHERKRIAADLHDNLGVYAASLSSNLTYLQPVNTDARTEEAMQELKNNSNAIISELNDTIWVLKKDTLSLTAISDRIKVFISRIRKSYPDIVIEVKEKIEADFLLPSSQAFHLYRIVQEAVNNSLRHSHGKSVTVEIITDSTWKVLIEDDGRGLIEGWESFGSGNGVANMKERCAEAGWVIKWTPTLGGGTVVEIYPTTN